MSRLAALALVLGSAAAHSAAAQRTDTSQLDTKSFSLTEKEAPLTLRDRGISLPIIEYTDDKGIVQRRRGIVLGTEVAPNTLIGVGLFDRMPRNRNQAPVQDPLATPRRNRGAAVGVTLKF